MAFNPRNRRTSALAPLWAAAGARWQAMSARERRMVALAAAAVGGMLLWLLLLRPALRTEVDAPPRIQQLRGQLAQAQAQADQLARLASLPPRASQVSDLQGAVRQWLQDHGAKAGVVSLPGAVNLQLQQLPPAALVELARTARRDWSAQVVAAKLRMGKDGMLEGSLQLQSVLQPGAQSQAAPPGQESP